MNGSTDAPLHLDHWRINRGRIGLAIFVFLLILGAAAVFTYFGPEHLCRIGYCRGPNERDRAACRSNFDHRRDE